MKLALTMAVQHMLNRKLRTALTTLAIVFGVMLLFGLNAIMPAMMYGLERSLLTSSNQVDITINGLMNGVFPQSTLETVRANPGIGDAAGILSDTILIPYEGEPNPIMEKLGMSSNTLTIRVTGVIPEEFTRVRRVDFVEGGFWQPGETGKIVLAQKLALKLDLPLGGKIVLPSSRGAAEFTVVGLTRADIMAVTDEVYITLSEAQTLLNKPDALTSIEIMVASGFDKTKVQTELEALLGSRFVFGAQKLTNEFASALELGNVAFYFFGVVALLMSGFIIFNTFRTIVAERRREIGLLRAVGASQKTILNLILVESLVQGVIGTLLGLLAGAGIAYGMIALVGPVWSEFARVEMGSPIFTPISWVISISLGIGMTVLAGLLPARNASRVTPLEALRPDVSTPQTLMRRSFIPGLVLIGISFIGLLTGDSQWVALGMLVFIIGLIWIAPSLVDPVARVFHRLIAVVFAREGRIAYGNMTRNPGRAAITASSVLISIAIMLAMLSMVSSIVVMFGNLVDTSLSADFLVLPQSLMIGISNVGAAPELSQQLAEIPGVEAVTGLRISLARVDDTTDIQMIGIDPQAFSQIAGLEFTLGDEALAYSRLAEGRWIILNPIFSAGKGFAVGQEIALETPSGRQVYKIAGIASDFLNAKISTAYISQTNLSNDFGENNDVLLMVNQKMGADSNAIFASLEKITVGYPSFTVISFTDLRASLLGLMDQVMFGMYFLLMILAIPSVLGLINTLAINVIERTREIGLMRAVGATRRQVSRMILAESILLTLLGTALGILAGLWMGYALISAMTSIFKIPYFLPGTELLIVIAMGLLIGVAAAWLPARQAARLNVIEALQYE